MSIGERIKLLRTDQHISQVQLAQYLSISRQAVSKWESDQACPDTLNLIKLSELLNTDVEYLATGNHIPRSSPPIVVNLVKKITPPQEHIVEKPVIRKVVQVKYRRYISEYVLIGVIAFILGIIVGMMI